MDVDVKSGKRVVIQTLDSSGMCSMLVLSETERPVKFCLRFSQPTWVVFPTLLLVHFPKILYLGCFWNASLEKLVPVGNW